VLPFLAIHVGEAFVVSEEEKPLILVKRLSKSGIVTWVEINDVE